MPGGAGDGGEIEAFALGLTTPQIKLPNDMEGPLSLRAANVSLSLSKAKKADGYPPAFSLMKSIP